MDDVAVLSRDQLLEKTRESLRVEWDRWSATLPPEGIYWPRCAVYIRESSADSLVGDAPLVQLRSTLAMLSAEQLYVPWDLVILENATGTEIAARAEFRRLLARAQAGEFKAIAAYLSSRFFRNTEEAMAVKRSLRNIGVELLWVGKPRIDPRDPSAFLLERHLEIADEWIPRQTSYMVSRQKEQACLNGIPIGGQLPEIWMVSKRGQSNRAGRPGSPEQWELVEPIASIVKEGVLRYLAGHSFQDLAEWCVGTAVKALTPRNRPMDRVWWQSNLQNPKLAGYQYRMANTGYKPGKDAPARARLKTRDLVPCVLPPIITLEQHKQLLALSAKRFRSGDRRREGYQVELLSGIAVDARCGHTVHIKRHAYGGKDFYLRCGERTIKPHGGHYRGSDASRDLDELMASVRFDDPVLVDLIDARLRAMDDDLAPVRRVSKEEVQLRSALNALDPEMFPDLRRQLLAQIDAVNANQEGAPPTVYSATFRAAVKDLSRWAEIWAEASVEDKNQLLRGAGVTAFVEPISREGRKGGWHTPDKGPHSRLVRVEAVVPEFALALAAATGMPGAQSEVEPSTRFDALGDSEHGADLHGAPDDASRVFVLVPDVFIDLTEIVKQHPALASVDRSVRRKAA